MSCQSSPSFQLYTFCVSSQLDCNALHCHTLMYMIAIPFTGGSNVVYFRTRPCSGPWWPLSSRRKRPALPPRRCAAAPVGTRYPSSGAPQPPCGWPWVPPPQRSAPRGSLSPWRSPLRTLPREETQEDGGEGGRRAGDGRRVSIDRGAQSCISSQCCMHSSSF